jgi:hypothetical protein
MSESCSTARSGDRARSRWSPRAFFGAEVIPSILFLGACAAQIGDPCQDNIDCSARGDRICDTAQREGYCTIQGCSARSCPDDAVCVAFYPVGFLTTPCDPEREDAVAPQIESTDDCRSDEVCLSSGLCAQSAQVQRFCMKPCERAGDCRTGYECGETGSAGAEAVPDPTNDEQVPRYRFCRQQIAR